MKVLLAFLCLILLSPIAKADRCSRYFNTPEKVARFTKQLVEKLAFSEALLNFLELPIKPEDDWSFHYARSVTWREQKRNLQIEVASAASLARSPEKLESAIREYSSSLEQGLDGSSTPGSFGRVGISIESTVYHHSFILGNQNTKYASFYVSLGESAILKSYSIKENLLEAEVHHVNTSTQQLVKTEKLQIYKYNGGLMVTIKYRNRNGFWNTDLWNRSRSVYIYDLEWFSTPEKTHQSFGL